MTPDELRADLDADLDTNLALLWAKVSGLMADDPDADPAVIRPYFAMAYAAGAQWASEQYQKALRGKQ